MYEGVERGVWWVFFIEGEGLCRIFGIVGRRIGGGG